MRLVALGGLAMAVVVAAVLGITEGRPDRPDGPVRVHETNGIKILVDLESSASAPFAEGGLGMLVTENGCVGFRTIGDGKFSAVVWPRGSRIVPHKAWPTVSTSFGDFAVNGDIHGASGGTAGANGVEPEVFAACPADAYVFAYADFVFVKAVKPAG